MVDTPFDGFTDTDHVQDADVLIGQRGSGGVNYLGSHFVKKAANGNFGIGVTTPSAAFTIGGGGALRLNHSDNATYNEIKYETGDIFAFNQANGGIYSFRINGTEQLRITASGNLGIGTSSPAANLDVVGSCQIGAFEGKVKFYSSSSYSGIYNGATLYTNEGLYWGFGLMYIVAGGANRLLINSNSVGPAADNVLTAGFASQRYSVVYAASGSINTSDEREKKEIGAIPEEWLDAWGEVQWSRFKFKDGNRWHIGLVAQRVHAAFESKGLDAFEIGLCCFDEWEERREPVIETVKVKEKDEKGKTVTRTETRETGETRVALAAGNRWGLRYDECFALEAAWQRRELSRMAERLAALETA